MSNGSQEKLRQLSNNMGGEALIQEVKAELSKLDSRKAELLGVLANLRRLKRRGMPHELWPESGKTS